MRRWIRIEHSVINAQSIRGTQTINPLRRLSRDSVSLTRLSVAHLWVSCELPRVDLQHGQRAESSSVADQGPSRPPPSSSSSSLDPQLLLTNVLMPSPSSDRFTRRTYPFQQRNSTISSCLSACLVSSLFVVHFLSFPISLVTRYPHPPLAPLHRKISFSEPARFSIVHQTLSRVYYRYANQFSIEFPTESVQWSHVPLWSLFTPATYVLTHFQRDHKFVPENVSCHPPRRPYPSAFH